MASYPTIPHNPLQQLHDLDKTSPRFHEQLRNFFHAYRDVWPSLQSDRLAWLVEYLDSVLLGASDQAGPVFQESLEELKRICGVKEVLPTSCILSESYLGCVYESTYAGAKVRVRRVRMHPGRDPQKSKELLHQMAVTSKHLSHPSIVPFLGVTVEPFEFISNWMPGGDLLGHIAKRPHANRVTLLSDVAEGLNHLHSHNVIHGDLNGSNILVDARGRARITDFGLAMVAQDLDSIRDTSAEHCYHNTRWIAPEILSSKGTYSKEADVFSFAGVMIEAFTGAAPFSGKSPDAAILAIMRGERPPRPAHPSLTEGLWTLIQRCWNREVHLRPQTLRISCFLGTPAWKRLIEGPLNSDVRVSLIADIFSDRDETEMVKQLRGDDAQSFVDVMDQMLDSLGPQLRKKSLSALCKMCGRQALLPRSLQIPLCYDRSGDALYSGGYADVWMGEHQGRKVAVKVLRIFSTSNLDKITSRFCREVMTWKSLLHPNVLPLLGVTMSHKHFAMVSEWMENGNINEFLKSNRDADRFELLKGITGGLIYMHSQGLIHGDLKGANVMIDHTGQARLADFGLLTFVSDPTDPTNSGSVTCAGTTRWMSPELLHPEQFGFEQSWPTKESDCYALGMVILEVLSEAPPFAGDKEFIVMRKVIEGKRPERPEGARFTDDLWRTLQQCWLPQPKGRPTIEAVFQCLGQVSRVPRRLPLVPGGAETGGDAFGSIPRPPIPNEQLGAGTPYDSPHLAPVGFNSSTGGPSGLAKSWLVQDDQTSRPPQSVPGTRSAPREITPAWGANRPEWEQSTDVLHDTWNGEYRDLVEFTIQRVSIDGRVEEEELNWWDPSVRQTHNRPGPGMLPTPLENYLHNAEHTLFSVSASPPEVKPRQRSRPSVPHPPSPDEVRRSIPHPNAYYCRQHNGWVLLLWKSSATDPPLSKSYDGPPLPDITHRLRGHSCVAENPQSFAQINKTHHFHYYRAAIDASKITTPFKRADWEQPSRTETWRRQAIRTDRSNPNTHDDSHGGEPLDLYICCQCSLYCILSDVIPGVIPQRTLEALIKEKQENPQVWGTPVISLAVAIDTILNLIEDRLWKGETRPLPIQRNALQSKLGLWSENIDETFRCIGFYLERMNNGQGGLALHAPVLDNSTLEGPANRAKLLRAWVELSAWLADFAGRFATELVDHFKTRALAKIHPVRELYQTAIGAHPKQLPRGDLPGTLRYKRELAEDWRTLGLTPSSYTPELLTFAYLAQCRCDPGGTMRYFTALVHIVQTIQMMNEDTANDLQNLVLDERTRGRFTRDDFLKAVATLGFGHDGPLRVEFDDSVEEEFVIDAWRDGISRSWKDETNGSVIRRELNDALRIIAEVRGNAEMHRVWESEKGNIMTVDTAHSTLGVSKEVDENTPQGV